VVSVIELAGTVLLLLAGLLALWSAGIANMQLPQMYTVLYGGEDYGHYGAEMMELAAVVPLVAAAALAVLAATIGAFANKRSLEDLRVHASGKGVGFVALMLASVGITTWLLPKAGSISGFVTMSLCAIVAMLACDVDDGAPVHARGRGSRARARPAGREGRVTTIRCRASSCSA
jgi:hypothetical protein